MPTKIMTRLLAGTAISALLTGAAMGAEARPYDIAAQDAATALQAYAMQSGRQVLFPYEAARGKTAPQIKGDYSDEQVLALLAASAGLQVTADDGKTVTLRPQLAQGAQGGGAAEVEALIVTAQKKEEAIQDVPIAISAFTAQALEEQKIEGGFDLLKAIPNVTFSKNNFTSYNFSIRGIGTKAVSATTDPGVAVSFNNIALIQNRLFEQEYFDVERVEVLRGPQGTLYGRNATAGVINVISAKPDMDEFKGWVKGEVGNYDTKRVSAMVNVPLVGDRLAVRLAGALTDRQGYDYNSITKNAVNGRDLWSARLTLGFEPTERIRGNLIWERFEEDDNRSRTGKQLCHHDAGPTGIGDKPFVRNPLNLFQVRGLPALYGQGCKPGSLYDEAAFGTPNGLSLPFVFAMAYLGTSQSPGSAALYPLGYNEEGSATTLVGFADPYGGMMQSSNLREIASFKDPVYRAKADLVELNFEFDLAQGLTLYSQTMYNKDSVYSFQDFNRFNTLPIFNDTAQLTDSRRTATNPTGSGPSKWAGLAPGGYFCDPQLGCSNTLAGFDISKAAANQFSQEFRVVSDLGGRLEFSAGINYTRFDVLVDYYVMYNLITAYALMQPFNVPIDGELGWDICPGSGFFGEPPAVPTSDPSSPCPYIDPNPVESINGEGHNYFRSKNPYKLKSGAAFGEIYWNFTDTLKLTAGLRYTDDHKTFIPVPTQVLLAPGVVAGGTVSIGHPELPPIKQHWGEWTGRIGLDWKPDLPFTESTMVYGFYAHGYKGGGANPPTPGFATIAEQRAQMLAAGFSIDQVNEFEALKIVPNLKLNGAEYGPIFRPEFVDAFEIGAKNSLLDGALLFNVGGFFYDYSDYQVSQIRDRSAVNENFDARVWGIEFETIFAPHRDLRIIANMGYLDTEIAKGMRSIDITNRTQGDPDYMVVKPWAQLTSNCVLPTAVLYHNLYRPVPFWEYCGVGGVLHANALLRQPFDPAFNHRYDPADYPELNGGAGLFADLSGNELPNSPHWTANLGAQYGFDFLDGWRATVRADAYWQSQSWARVFNAVNDKLHGWYNANLSLWLENDDGLKIELYAKNILDKTPITDAFINSDDTALTTNVFVLDPRLIGLSIRKEF